MKTIGKTRLTRRGWALGSAIAVIALLLCIGTGLLSLGLQRRFFSVRTVDEIAARTAADAGLSQVMCEMNTRLKAQSLESASLPRETGQTIAGCDATFGYKVVANSLSSDKEEYYVTVTGAHGRAQREIEAVARLQGPFEAAILVSETLVMKPSSIVDGYNYSEPGESLLMATLSTLPDQITLGRSAVVNGDVAVGMGGDPETVISASDATITGRTYALSDEAYWPRVALPAWLSGAPSGGTIKAEGTISTSGRYDGIILGRGDILTIDNNVTLYVSGDISLSNSAQLQISDSNPHASLVLFLGGNLYCKNGGAINNLTKDATRLKVFGLEGCTNISMATAGTFYGAICAPNAAINLKSSVEIHGSVLGNNLNQGSTANFYYDAALKNVSIGDPCVRFVIKRWKEM